MNKRFREFVEEVVADEEIEYNENFELIMNDIKSEAQNLNFKDNSKYLMVYYIDEQRESYHDIIKNEDDFYNQMQRLLTSFLFTVYVFDKDFNQIVYISSDY